MTNATTIAEAIQMVLEQNNHTLSRPSVDLHTRNNFYNDAYQFIRSTGVTSEELSSAGWQTPLILNIAFLNLVLNTVLPYIATATNFIVSFYVTWIESMDRFIRPTHYSQMAAAKQNALQTISLASKLNEKRKESTTTQSPQNNQEIKEQIRMLDLAQKLVKNINKYEALCVSDKEFKTQNNQLTADNTESEDPGFIARSIQRVEVLPLYLWKIFSPSTYIRAWSARTAAKKTHDDIHRVESMVPYEDIAIYTVLQSLGWMASACFKNNQRVDTFNDIIKEYFSGLVLFGSTQIKSSIALQIALTPVRCLNAIFRNISAKYKIATEHLQDIEGKSQDLAKHNQKLLQEINRQAGGQQQNLDSTEMHKVSIQASTNYGTQSTIGMNTIPNTEIYQVQIHPNSGQMHSAVAAR